MHGATIKIVKMYLLANNLVTLQQWRTQDFFFRGGGFQQIQLRTEYRENGDLGAVAP